MIIQLIAQSITQPIVRSVFDSGPIFFSSSEPVFTPEEQKASLFLDFERRLYGEQSVDAAIANSMDPLPSLFLDFQSSSYFAREA